MHFTLTTHTCITLLTLLYHPAPQDSPKMLRTVKGQVLTSPEKPAARLTFEKAFHYVGGHAFVLYGVANAEQHFFVDADENKKIRQFYWVQFEGYLPSNTHTYRYNSKTKAKLGPLEFFADASPRRINPGGRPDSDGAKAQAFLASKGYQMASPETLTQRLVHLTDDSRRDELMIIYAEDLSPMKLAAADLAANGKAHDQWPAVSKALLERAVKGVELVKE